jgi:hypothetical protein
MPDDARLKPPRVVQKKQFGELNFAYYTSVGLH